MKIIASLLVILGLFVIALFFVFGIIIITEAGYNQGTLEDMIVGAVVIVVGSSLGATCCSKGFQFSESEKRGGK